jgi:hypothetical protein
LDATGDGYAAQIISLEVYEHEVLGSILGSYREVFSGLLVVGTVMRTPTRTLDGAGRKAVLIQL